MSAAKPGLAGAIVSQLAILDTVSTPWEAEMATSVVLGAALEAGVSPQTLPATLAEAADEVADRLARADPPHGYAALRALAAVGPPEIAHRASEAAAELDSGAAPSWVAGLGQVSEGPCYVATDEFGETRTVLCEFSYSGEAKPHGVLGVLDEAWFGAVGTLATSGDRGRRRMEKQVKRKGGEFREVIPAEAGALLREGIASFWHNGLPPDAKADGVMCSSLHLAAARAAALAAGPARAVTARDRWPDEALDQLVEEFLASPPGRGFSRTLPHLVAKSCVVHLGCDPTLIGPTVLDRLLLGVLPAVVLGPDRSGQYVQPVVRAWAEWLAERNDLPPRARRRLMTAERLSRVRFGRAWYGPDASPLRRYLEDLSDSEADELITAVIERRTFAVPAPADRTGEVAPRRSAGELDAADEADRALITALEAAAGLVPVERLPAYLAVVRQLWDDDPRDVWEAARRMLAAGSSRAAVLEALAETWERSGSDSERYAAALAKLPTLRGSGTSAPGSTRSSEPSARCSAAWKTGSSAIPRPVRAAFRKMM
jgi:hypothetical protein